MPSTIIGSTSWNATGLVLSAQSAQEQVTGLVNVQVTYVAPVTKQAQASAKFYTDSPPPIWPSVVSRSELVTNNLYLVDRTIERANGLVTINANYAGALQRAGFRGYYLREQIEYGKTARAYTYGRGIDGSLITVITPGGSRRESSFPTKFYYDERLKIVEFVRIGREQAVSLPAFFRADMASISQQRRTGKSTVGLGVWSYTNSVLNGTPVFNPNAGIGTWTLKTISEASWSSDAPIADAADVWIVSGPDEEMITGRRSFEKTTPVPSTESVEYVTPTVQVVSLTYRLSR